MRLYPAFGNFILQIVHVVIFCLHSFAVWRVPFALRKYDGPILEPLDLLVEKSGPEIVGQLFNFEDKGGRAVALRPEMTPTWRAWWELK